MAKPTKPPVSQFVGLKGLSDKSRTQQPFENTEQEQEKYPERDKRFLPTANILANVGEMTKEEKITRKKIGRPKGKRSNPDFEQTTLFLRTDTKRAVNRQLEDHGAGDLSSLVERLLAGWLKRQ